MSFAICMSNSSGYLCQCNEYCTTPGYTVKKTAVECNEIFRLTCKKLNVAYMVSMEFVISVMFEMTLRQKEYLVKGNTTGKRSIYANVILGNDSIQCIMASGARENIAVSVSIPEGAHVSWVK